MLHAFEANVDICRPGDRVAITGILRALPIRVNPTQRTLHALFKVCDWTGERLKGYLITQGFGWGWQGMSRGAAAAACSAAWKWRHAHPARAVQGARLDGKGKMSSEGERLPSRVLDDFGA